MELAIIEPKTYNPTIGLNLTVGMARNRMMTHMLLVETLTQRDNRSILMQNLELSRREFTLPKYEDEPLYNTNEYYSKPSPKQPSNLLKALIARI